MHLPNFIIIGAMKAGTGSLYAALKKHPEIGMSRVKETNYFSHNYRHKGIGWYKRMFEHHGADKKIFGEASPNYTKKHLFPGTAKRIKENIPEVKLIYIVRDPIDRIISHLHHNLYSDRLKREEIDQKVLKNDHYIKTSSYYYQIEEYLKYFDRSQILFLELNDLKPHNFQNTLNKISKFLGIELVELSLRNTNAHPSSDKYFVKNKKLALKLLPVKVYNQYIKYYRKRNIKISKPILKESTLNLLRERLNDDMKKFKAIVNEK